jgi:DNA (cytosine-5)-methyltransferase 1
MRLLDLFCGAGGAAMGYHRAGFEVVGVDNRPQPHYPFEFHQADALTYPLDGFDVIHASPPCQAFSRVALLAERQGGRRSTVDLIAPTRARLAATGLPYVIENVVGAPVEGMSLCGSMFGLAVRRHRIFESNLWLGSAGPCRHREQGKPVGLFGRMGDHVKGIDTANLARGVFHGGRTAATIEEAQEAIGIDWTRIWPELKEAIPPAYTEWLGRQLMAHLARAAA